MQPLPVSTDLVERQCALTSLSALVLALTRAMAESGLRGADVEQVFAQNVDAKCVLCGIALSGTDLLLASLHDGTAPDKLPAKLKRLRLGYCARNTCTSSYYLVKLAPMPNIDWSELWFRADNSIAVGDDSVSEVARNPLKILVSLQYLRHPVTICGLVVVLVILFVQGGCRIPGLSPKPRVFIVSSLAPLPLPSFLVPAVWQQGNPAKTIVRISRDNAQKAQNVDTTK
jgi:hypothetical protein